MELWPGVEVQYWALTPEGIVEITREEYQEAIMPKNKGNGGRVLRSYERKMNQGTPKRLALNEAMGGQAQEKTLPKAKK